MANVKLSSIQKKQFPDTSYDLCTDDEQKTDDKLRTSPSSKTQVSGSEPSDPALLQIDTELQFLRKQLLGESSASDDNYGLKHLLQNYDAVVSSAVPLIFDINGVTQGTTTLTRLGNAIKNVSTTFRFRFQYSNNSSGSGFLTPASTHPTFVRFVVAEYFLPEVVPATFASVVTTSTTLPTTDTQIFFTGTASPDGQPMMMRNPLTRKVARILHDEIIPVAPASFASYVAVPASSTIQVGASCHMRHVKHRSTAIFTSTTATSTVSNQLLAMWFTDNATLVGTDGCALVVQGTADFVFQDSGLD